MPLTVGQIVRVVRQPPNQIVQLQGEVGWIEELQGDDMAYFRTLHLDDLPGGMGSVPLGCLAPEPGAQWEAAKVRHDARVEKMVEENRIYNERYKEHVATVAAKYGVTPEIARAIHDELGQM